METGWNDIQREYDEKVTGMGCNCYSGTIRGFAAVNPSMLDAATFMVWLLWELPARLRLPDLKEMVGEFPGMNCMQWMRRCYTERSDNESFDLSLYLVTDRSLAFEQGLGPEICCERGGRSRWGYHGSVEGEGVARPKELPGILAGSAPKDVCSPLPSRPSVHLTGWTLHQFKYSCRCRRTAHWSEPYSLWDCHAGCWESCRQPSACLSENIQGC